MLEILVGLPGAGLCSDGVALESEFHVFPPYTF
jgi:hypothetical protein